MDFQNGVVGRHRLECDIGMPTIAGKLAWFCEFIDWGNESILLPYAADDADLVAELAVGLGDWMYV